jgi:hypothetical protein
LAWHVNRSFNPCLSINAGVSLTKPWMPVGTHSKHRFLIRLCHPSTRFARSGQALLPRWRARGRRALEGREARAQDLPVLLPLCVLFHRLRVAFLRPGVVFLRLRVAFLRPCVVFLPPGVVFLRPGVEFHRLCVVFLRRCVVCLRPSVVLHRSSVVLHRLCVVLIRRCAAKAVAVVGCHR